MIHPPRSLYVHIPFCERKCFYCAFNSEAGNGRSEKESYLRALRREFDAIDAASWKGLKTVYVGGGTPSSLDDDLFSDFLGDIGRRLDFGNLEEWTVEVNPGTATPAKVRALRSSGVNRVSMGVQSMDPRRLKALGRIHGPDEVRCTVADLREAGIENLSLDLIYGLPFQSPAEWETDVEKTLALGPDHLSLYALNYEEGTPYGDAHARGKLQELPEDEIRAMFNAAKVRLNTAGLELYEISNFARPGRESRHNQTYWRNEPYFGCGAGAFSRVGNERRRNEEDFRRYITLMNGSGNAVAERDRLGSREDYVESLASGLRTRAGIDLDAISMRTGFDPRRMEPDRLAGIVGGGLAILQGVTLSLTDDGLWVLDGIVREFIPAIE